LTTYKDFKYEAGIKAEGYVYADVRKYGLHPQTKQWVELRRVDYKMFFIGPLEWRLKRAQRWTDSLIHKCQKYETGREIYA
jgi:hypothetical protein